ncbi:GGDEF domain-containing protein [Pseudothauera rhizosphaerae]|uniref:diguanylate cyclase n=1 Tax=Pseudothauera rhizosphaerae TaxID=2565932 RepID=A0A4S4AU40_9RHOO|nr:GGDEF domain-containing protein [Pseudothauera rhizosphaerae]THF63274.1 GGDEF domain-containing protein [Pseudothauera rhizosphaerae]
MYFDDPTLMFAVTVVGAANAVVLVWGALLGACRQPLLYWAAANGLAALAASMVLILAESGSPWLGPLFNSFFLLGHACWLVGTLHFFGRRVAAGPLAALLILSIVATVWLGVVSPDRALRIFLAASTAAILRLFSAIVLLRFSGTFGRRAVALAVALVMLIDAGVLALHAHIGLAGVVPLITGSEQNDPFILTWITMLLSTAVATPLLMLLALSRLLDDLKRSAHYDSLTGLPNRRGFFERIGPLLEQGRRQGQTGSVLVVDIDRFKHLNDRFGHAMGDEVLCVMGAVLNDVLRGVDTAVRWGGEEFCALLPDTGGSGAYAGAERIRAEFSRRCRAIPALAEVPMSVSIGVASGRWNEVDFDTLQHRADAALYAAKHGGRDRTVLAGAETVAC